MALEPSPSGERVVDLTRSGLLGDATRVLVTCKPPVSSLSICSVTTYDEKLGRSGWQGWVG